MSKSKVGSDIPVYPMPVIILGANVQKKPNFLTVVWFSMVNFKPPIIAVALDKGHFTNIGVRENRTFSINVPSTKLLETTDYLSVISGFDLDKSKILDVFYGELNTSPMIQACPITAECKVIQVIEFATHDIFFGEIVATYAERNVLSRRHPDIAKIKPIIYSMYDHNYWEMGKRIGRARHVSKKIDSGSTA